jgi:hypothetical protein
VRGYPLLVDSMPNVRVNILNSHIATYNGVTRNLKQGGVLYLNTDKIAERKELMYLLTASPHRNKYAVELNDALLGVFNVSVLDTAPSHPADPEVGRIYWNTALGKAFLYNGQGWMEYPAGGGSGGGGDAPIAVIPSLFGDVTSTGFSNEVQIAPGVITDADISAGARIRLSKLEVDPRNRATHIGVQPASSISDFDAQVRTNRLDQLAGPASSVNINDQFLTNVRAPINAKDGANKEYVDASISSITLCSLPPSTCDIDMGGFRILNLGNPVAPTDAVNLRTLQSALAASPIKAPARLIANTHINTLSGTGVTIDGRPVVIDNRVVLNGQNDPRQNGIYIVSAGAWMRAPDADENLELAPGSQISITDGATQAGTVWVQTQPTSQTVVGASAIAYSPMNGVSTFNAGTGLTSTGNTLNVNGTPNRVVTLADTVDIAPNYAGQTSITTLGAVTTGQWRGTPVDVTFGGTGATNAADARANLGAARAGANGDITSLIGLTTPLAINQGGTGATTAPDARTNLGAASRGVNSDITQLTGITTPLSISQGGTGANNAPQARANLQAARSGINSDITSFTTLDPGAITVLQGGTGASTPAGARVALSAVGAGLNLLPAASNRGQMFRQVVSSVNDVTMEFRVLEEGPGINLTQTTNSVVVEVDVSTLNLPSLSGQINLATQVIGILPVTNGGTGASTPLVARQNLSAASSIVSMGGTSLVHAVPYNASTTNLQLKGLSSDPELVITANANDLRLGINQSLLNLSAMGGQVDLNSKVSGTLPIANGGTGANVAGQALDNLNGVFSARSLGGTSILGTPVLENVPASGERLLFKGIESGIATLVVDNGTATALKVDVVAANVGAGTGTILKTPVTSSLDLRTITGSGSITVTTSGDEINISGAPISVTSVGTGQPVLVNPAASPLQFRSILGRYGITDSTVGQDIVLDLDGSNVGTGQGVFVVPTGIAEGSAQFKTLAPVSSNSGLVITSTATEVQFQAVIAGATNLGTGSLLLANPGATTAGTILNFRSLVAGNGISLAQTANNITITANLANIGAGAPVLVPGTTHNFKTLVEGTGITLTQTATDITIASTLSSASNVGTGVDVLITPITAGAMNLRRVLGRYGTIASLVGSDVVVDFDAENVGTGAGVLVAPVTTDTKAQYRSLRGSTGLIVTQADTEVQFQTVVAGAINVGVAAVAPATTTAQLLANGPITAASTVAEFKSITSSDNSVTISQTATQIDLKSNNKAVGFHTTAATFTNPGSLDPSFQSITHNLGTNQVMVQVRDANGQVLTNYRVNPGAAGSNTVGISWGSPTAIPVGAATVFIMGLLP